MANSSLQVKKNAWWLWRLRFSHPFQDLLGLETISQSDLIRNSFSLYWDAYSFNILLWKAVSHLDSAIWMVIGKKLWFLTNFKSSYIIFALATIENAVFFRLVLRRTTYFLAFEMLGESTLSAFISLRGYSREVIMWTHSVPRSPIFDEFYSGNLFSEKIFMAISILLFSRTPLKVRSIYSA